MPDRFLVRGLFLDNVDDNGRSFIADVNMSGVRMM